MFNIVLIILYSSIKANQVDEVIYSSSGLWTSLPNGNGPTLSLVNPQLDNSLAESWKASGFSGTPGYLNDIYTKAESENDLVPTEFILYQNYPNPCHSVTSIEFSLKRGGDISINLYDLSGRKIMTIVDEFMHPDNYKVTVSLEMLKPGTYFYSLKVGNNLVRTRKMIVF